MSDNPVLNDRYRLIEQIGSGGMAVIYRAQDMELGRTVSIKILRPSLVDDPEFLIRFKREAQAAANMTHPNIVTVHDVGQDGPRTHYIVMEFVPGQDLKKLVRARGTFDVDAALAMIIEVCKGVGFAHRAGLVHCDIKPQNILITPDNMVKVTDFGIARALSLTQPEEVEEIVWGSPHYFAPEQAMGQVCTPASDVYSIGIVLFELLTGRLPFTGNDYRDLAMAHIKQDPPTLTSVNPALPQELDRILSKVLAKEPSARYRTADQLGRILEKYREQGRQATGSFAVTPSRVAPPPPAAEPTMRSARPIDSSDDTMPSLPPVDMDAYLGRPSVEPMYVSPQPVRPVYDEYDDQYDSEEYEEDIVPGLDIFGLVLGVLAAVAVLGLIPLWLTVWFTLT
jgi:serine/threonine protein kinase